MSDRIPDESPNGKAGGSDPAGSFIPDNDNSAKPTPGASPPHQMDLTGADLAAAAVAGHGANDRPEVMTYVTACEVALLRETEHGPCSMARARHVHGVRAPAGVEPRASGAAAISLHKAGRIEPAGRHEPSPWKTCHATHGQLWRRPSRGMS